MSDVQLVAIQRKNINYLSVNVAAFTALKRAIFFLMLRDVVITVAHVAVSGARANESDISIFKAIN